jgi:opacity protein-like surface antigen
MKKLLSAAALTVAFAVPSMAATLDFTANDATSGTVLGTTWTVTASPGSLTNARHGNDVGCTGAGWDFACNKPFNNFDVGFGVAGSNNNEIDGNIRGDEYVQVTFGSLLKVTGFAGMLAYANSSLEGAREQVELEYSSDGGNTWLSLVAEPLFRVNEVSGPPSFDTVGLAFLDGLSVIADRVRFKATGTGTADDGSFNVTAAGLSVAEVPLPAGGLLLLGAIGGIAALRRRKAA